MTSCLEFLFLVTQIALLMRFSEVPILKNDFISGQGGEAAFIIDCNISVSNNNKLMLLLLAKYGLK